MICSTKNFSVCGTKLEVMNNRNDNLKRNLQLKLPGFKHKLCHSMINMLVYTERPLTYEDYWRPIIHNQAQ